MADAAAGPALQFGGVIVHSEIYQITGPLERYCRMLASEGFVVAIGECYHELEPAGTVLEYNQHDTDRGNKNKVGKPVQAYDTDNEALVRLLLARPDCNGRIGTVGMCLGGHLALRCGFVPEVRPAGPYPFKKRREGERIIGGPTLSEIY